MIRSKFCAFLLYIATSSLLLAADTPIISWSNPPDIIYGMTLGGGQLNATANVPGTFTYSPPRSTTLQVGNGQVLSVSFQPDDTAHYTSASASVTINVLPKPQNVTSRNFSVEVSASVQSSPPQITLSWPADGNATSYAIYRKSKDDAAWPQSIASLPASATSYTDTNVATKSAYEYRIVKSALEGSTGYPYNGYGFIYAGIEAPAIEARGQIVLIVDNSMTAPLADKLSRLQDDLRGDGWVVIRHEVSRSDSVQAVKNLIVGDYNAAPQDVKCVFLFGHVPVPYSGVLNPDGHMEHLGAWPADVFYANMSGQWTDTTANQATADHPENWNVPGDGKFDQSIIPGNVELQLGRVDLANMPAFGKSETDLLAQYLDKDHNFRIAKVSLPRHALVDDLFPAERDAFAATGFINFAPFFGSTNITTGDWFSTLSSQGNLWAYGCGPGTPTSIVGLGATSDFASHDTQAVFTMLFGSWFGDWDNQDNFLRAPLCTPSYTLTCVWGGRPWWYFHHMSLGETIGYGVRLSQNNVGDVYPVSNNPYRRDFHKVHMALMGDPTLRMHAVQPPANVAATVVFTGVNLTWDASPEPVIGYHVYRAANRNGPFKRVNRAMVSGTSFTDSNTAAGTFSYMVRAIKLETSASGTYQNPSQGAFLDVTRDTPGDAAPVVSITSPANGVSYVAPALILITANASDSDGTVTRVDFYADDLLLGSVSQAPYEFLWENVPAGSYVLSADAVDEFGVTGTSDSVGLTIANSLCDGLNPTPFSDPALSVSLRFPSSLQNALNFRGTIQLPDGFNVASAQLQWQIAGILGSVVLDEHGNSPKSSSVKAQLRFKRPAKGQAFTARPARLSIALKKQALSQLQLRGIPRINANSKDKRGDAASADVCVVLNSQTAFRVEQLSGLYKAKKDKSASFVTKK